jgi:hypothetical protein
MVTTTAAPILVAGTVDRRAGGFSRARLDGDAEGGASTRCAARSTSASARRRGRMTVTSEAPNALSGMGETLTASPGAGWAGRSNRCCAPQEEQNLAISADGLPQF